MNLLGLLPDGWGKHKGCGEWAGPCPNCGGTDRFVVWPEHKSGAAGGRFLCRGCGAQGDAVEFLRVFQNLTYREACEALRLEMPPLVAVCFYDFAVNAGVPRAARMLQGLLRVEADGIVGRNTLTAAESCNQRELASFMLLERERWYRGLVAKKPKSAAFLRGWLNRTSDCRALVERLAARWGIVE